MFASPDNCHEKALPTREELGRQIVETVRRLDTLMKSAIVLPADHEWWAGPNRLNFGDGPVQATEYGVSLFIRKRFANHAAATAGVGDPDQVAVEIRVMLPRAQYATKKGVQTYRAHDDAQYSAILWVQSGPQWAGKSTDHMDQSTSFPKGATPEAFVIAVASAVNAALYRAVPQRMPPATPRMTADQYAAEVARLETAIAAEDAGKKDPTKTLAQKVEHNRARNLLQEDLRQLKLRYFTVVENP
ncbi:hypothetical protein [Burkholderia sp. Ac-20365]|uniref:hypothetical protein n=1 Tax=Burkholderia sp. Ac-20365 TaxID=2703897 RepID=UPI00197BE0AC|nr:hypothetical protein [Burkholderia sp. Ac-20365]MBN3760936.1 hypothetical protein [Burkholderia sp. Ac-20365]